VDLKVWGHSEKILQSNFNQKRQQLLVSVVYRPLAYSLQREREHAGRGHGAIANSASIEFYSKAGGGMGA